MRGWATGTIATQVVELENGKKKKKKKRRKYDMTVPITYFTALLFSVETNSPMLYEYKW